MLFSIQIFNCAGISPTLRRRWRHICETLEVLGDLCIRLNSLLCGSKCQNIRKPKPEMLGISFNIFLKNLSCFICIILSFPHSHILEMLCIQCHLAANFVLHIQYYRRYMTKISEKLILVLNPEYVMQILSQATSAEET